jgi:hypothetical protein
MPGGIESAGENKKEFVFDQIEDEQRTIFKTDDEGLFIEQIFWTLIEDVGETDRIKLEVIPQGDRWYRVEFSFPPDLGWEEFAGDGYDLDSAFGKDFYDCREEGRADDFSKAWYVVRHRHGAPWM